MTIGTDAISRFDPPEARSTQLDVDLPYSISPGKLLLLALQPKLLLKELIQSISFDCNSSSLEHRTNLYNSKLLKLTNMTAGRLSNLVLTTSGTWSIHLIWCL